MKDLIINFTDIKVDSIEGKEILLKFEGKEINAIIIKKDKNIIYSDYNIPNEANEIIKWFVKRI